MCWSGCSLLVDDLKAAAALLSSVVVEAGYRLGVAGYYTRPIMHAPHTLRLTLANIQRKTFFKHESFDHAWQNAVRRCSTLASMYSSHAMQQEQSSSDGEGRDCSSPRTHRGAPAALWAL